MSGPRTIGVVTVSRSDYGIYVPVLRRIQQEPSLRLELFVTGMHLSPLHGLTIREIEADGFPIAQRVPMLDASDEPEAIARSMATGIAAFAKLFAPRRPELLMVLGDRFEMYAAAIAALPFHIPIAHLHGGESTGGLIDEAIRHAITKMSHLHFVSMERYAQRLIQMGEEPWRVIRSGAPALDHLRTMEWLSDEAVRARFGLDVSRPFLLVTYHPVTLQYEHTETQVRELLVALEEVGQPVIFTYPNADTHGQRIIQMIEAFARSRADVQVAINAGTVGYFHLMRRAAAMVGNSSSGIIESGSFKLPVVNVGDRQRGRFHDEHVLDVPCERAQIAEAIRRTLSPAFRSRLEGLVNSYGDGYAAERIVSALKETPLDGRLLMKQFHEPLVLA